jgi:EmrB/QacA subfamily drug resistance transporter
MSPSSTNKWVALALLAAAQFVVVLDASIVNVALPSIGKALEFSQDNLSWVVNAYVLVFGGFLLLGGRIADLLGRRRLFVAGLILFAAASLAGGLAQSAGWLVAARAVQGLGAALLSPAALSLVTVLFAEGSERNRAMGVWGAAVGSGGAVGVLLGGMLTEWAGWEWVLFVNVPIGIFAAALAMRLLPESRNDGERHFDIAGALSITAGLSLLVYALVDANSAGWGSAQTLGLGALALALIAGFYVIERRQKAPLVPFPGIFRMRTITGINVSAVLIAAALFSMFFFISLYMQNVLGFSALKAGIAYLPLAVGIILTAGASAPLVTRFGFKPVLVTGLIVTAGGLLWFSQVDADGSYVGDILFPSLLAAIGLGLAFVSMTVAAVSGVEPHEAGLASGRINTSQQIGGALGLAILATVANSRTDDAVAVGKPAAVALTEGFQNAFLVGAGMAIAGAILAIVLVSSRASREHAQAAQRGELDPVPAAA